MFEEFLVRFLRSVSSPPMYWNCVPVPPESWVCGYCSENVAANQGMLANKGNMSMRPCPRCRKPSLFLHGSPLVVLPRPLPGRPIAELPPDVRAIYEEARAASRAAAHTGSVMLCRQILMHVAIEKGVIDAADPKALRALTFKACVEFLDAEHLIPPNWKAWVEYLLTRGNDAIHRLVPMTAKDSEGVLYLTEQLLRIVYELPNRVPPLAP